MGTLLPLEALFCTICQHNILETQEELLLHCGHIFHNSCMRHSGVYQATCPRDGLVARRVNGSVLAEAQRVFSEVSRAFPHQVSLPRFPPSRFITRLERI